MDHTPYLSVRASSNLVRSALAEVRSYCFYNQYDPETNPDGIVALAIAENKLMRDEIVQHVNDHFKINPWHLTYGHGAQGSIELRTEIAQFVNREFEPFDRVGKDDVVVCNGVGSAVDNLCFCFGEPGDGVLVGRPLYTGFFPDIEARAKVKPVLVSFGTTDPLSPAAVQHYEDALLAARAAGTTVRALLLANPHNPLGRPYPRDSLTAYLRLCAKHNIHLISDEVYCKSAFPSADFPDPPPFVSVLSLDPTAAHIPPALVHVLYGMSKDFCANGLRAACVVSPSNEPLLRALRAIAPFTRASQLAEHAWLNVLADTAFAAWYFPELRRRMAAAYTLATTALRAHHVPYHAASVSSFLWIDLRRFLREPTRDAELALNWRMAREGKVWIAMGASFGAEEPGWFRLTFASPRAELEMGLARLWGVLERVEREMRADVDEGATGAWRVKGAGPRINFVRGKKR